MSYQIGIDTLFLRPTPRIAHTEYSDHGPLQQKVARQTGRPFTEAWDYDLLWVSNDGPDPWDHSDKLVDMGHAEYADGGVDFRPTHKGMFDDVEDVYRFDVNQTFEPTDFDELVAFYQRFFQGGQADHPHLVFPGGYYHTMVSGAIAAFGWELLLEAAADQARFAEVIDRFYQRTLHHVKAWAATDIAAFIQHDDFVWSAGAFMDPSFYRKVIIPRYAHLWDVLHDAGKKVLFCSDANWIGFLDDIVDAGADGFIFEPMMPLEPVVERYGQTHVIVGSKVDCRTMAFGTVDQIRNEVDATLELARDCPGFVVAVGNHIPANVPIDHCTFYIDYLRDHWAR